jgi:hypothetical protein
MIERVLEHSLLMAFLEMTIKTDEEAETYSRGEILHEVTVTNLTLMHPGVKKLALVSWHVLRNSFP